MAEVRLEHVYKIFKTSNGAEIAAVSDFNLTIEDQEFVVLVGPSGCGKSTTLRMIAGLESVTKGNIYVNKTRINNLPPQNRDMAMVFQDYALYPHMTVYQNMAYALKLQKFSTEEIDRRVREASQMMGLTTEILRRKPNTLSGGQCQRAAVGRAIVRKPQAFLFDEPLSNLDAKMRMQMRTEISKLHTRLRSTMIYVTHDQVEAMTMSDRIVIMKDGLIQQVAEPMTIYQHPVNLFVAGFIGSPPMNFLKGSIKLEKNRLYFIESLREDGVPLQKLRIPNEMSSKLESHVDKSIILGIRPEDIFDKLYVRDPDPEYELQAVVEVIEPMGAETILYLKTGHHTCIARCHGYIKVDVNRKIDLVLDMKKAHFFDAVTENALI